VVRRRLLLALVIGVPVVFLRTLNDPINVPKLGLLLIVVPLVAAIRAIEVLQGAGWRGLARPAFPAATIALPLCIAWVLSPYKTWALLGNYPRFGGLIPYLLAIAFGVLLADAFAGRAIEVARAVVAAGAVVGAYAAIQFLGLDPFTWSLRGGEASRLAVSTLGNTNFVGGFLGIVSPVAVALFVLEPRRRRLLAAATGSIAVGLAVSASEAGWAASLAGVVVVLGFLFRTRWRFAKLAGVVVAALVFVVVVGSVALAMVRPAEGEIAGTAARRADWWDGALAMASDAPAIGRGPAVFAIEGTQYRTAEDGRQAGFGFTDDPHSVFLSYLTSAGVAGVVGFLAALAWLIRSGFAADADDILRAPFLAAVVAYVVQASVSIDTIALRVAFWTVAAGLIASRPMPVEEADAPRAKRGPSRRVVQPLRLPIFVGVIIVLVVAAAWWGVRFVAADARVQHADRLWAEGDIGGFQSEFEQALAFRDEPAYRRVYGERLGDVAVALAAEGHMEPARAFLARARDAFAYTETLPQANALVEYARILFEWATYEPAVRDEALALYERALELDPRNPALVAEVQAARAAPPSAPTGEQT